ncbi:MAG: phage baseplate assembly protein [Cycloclasticus sp.]
MSNVRLKVDGVIHTGWLKVRLSFSMESIANRFSLTLTDKWSSGSSPRAINMGAACEVWIDNTKVITGYIDDVTPNYNASQHTIVVTGRSKAGDLVDCTHKDGQSFDTQTLKQVADTLCKPFGIKVLVSEGVDIGKPFGIADAIETGESIFEFLEQKARIRALRIVSNIEGDIVITRASKNRINTPLILGENILSASGEFSQRDRFSEVSVLGSQSGDDNTWGASAAHIKGTYSDKAIGRHRPLAILADSSLTLDDAKKRAQWEVNTRYGRSKGIVYTVNGWQHKTGLWQPNFLVSVQDSYTDIDGDLLISEVVLVIDDGGELAEIKVMPTEAFELIELPEPAEDVSGF